MRTELPPRDLQALAAIGRFRMLARPHLKRWFFRDVSEAVVTRFVKRVEGLGYAGVERLHGNGVQILWLTRKGRDMLLRSGVADVDLFPASGPAAAKDFTHTEAIGAVAAWLSAREPVPDELLPAWALQRHFEGKLRVIPDLLALWRPIGSSAGAALAIEVDLGTEPLDGVFRPKLSRLAEALVAWLPGGLTSILVLVTAKRRAVSLRAAVVELPVPILVEVLHDTLSL